MAGDQIDVNRIVDDDKAFRVYVVMRLHEGGKQMAEQKQQLKDLAQNGCEKHALVDRRLSRLEGQDRRSRERGRTVQLLAAALGAAAGKAADTVGGMLGR